MSAEQPLVTGRERAVSFLLASGASLFATWFGTRASAMIGDLSYAQFTQALALRMSAARLSLGDTAPRFPEQVPLHDSQATLVLYLWCLIPAILLAVRVARLVKAGSQEFSPSNALGAFIQGYLAGLCFALLTGSIYYAYFMTSISRDGLSFAPSVMGLLSDWMALSNAVLAGILYLALWFLFRPGKGED